MKKPNTYYATIGIDVFKTGILVLVNSDIKVLLSDLDAIFDAIGIEKEEKVEDIKTITKFLNPEDDDDVTALGQCITTGKTNDVVVIFQYDDVSDISLEVIVHKMYHAMKAICRHRLINDEETEAYLLEHLVHSMLNKIDDYNVEKEKRSKEKEKKAVKKKPANDKHPKKGKEKP